MIRNRITTPKGSAPPFDTSARDRVDEDRSLRRNMAPRLRAWLLRSGRRSLGQIDGEESR